MIVKKGRRPLPELEKIVQITLNVKKKFLGKARREALIIEAKYR